MGRSLHFSMMTDDLDMIDEDIFEHDCHYKTEADAYRGCQELLEELIHNMYKTGNVEAMEEALENLTGYWGINLPRNAPRIQPMRTHLFADTLQAAKEHELTIHTP